jgi:hypothetical protein
MTSLQSRGAIQLKTPPPTEAVASRSFLISHNPTTNHFLQAYARLLLDMSECEGHFVIRPDGYWHAVRPGPLQMVQDSIRAFVIPGKIAKLKNDGHLSIFEYLATLIWRRKALNQLMVLIKLTVSRFAPSDSYKLINGKCKRDSSTHCPDAQDRRDPFPELAHAGGILSRTDSSAASDRAVESKPKPHRPSFKNLSKES